MPACGRAGMHVVSIHRKYSDGGRGGAAVVKKRIRKRKRTKFTCWVDLDTLNQRRWLLLVIAVTARLG